MRVVRLRHSIVLALVVHGAIAGVVATRANVLRANAVFVSSGEDELAIVVESPSEEVAVAELPAATEPTRDARVAIGGGYSRASAGQASGTADAPTDVTSVGDSALAQPETPRAWRPVLTVGDEHAIDTRHAYAPPATSTRVESAAVVSARAAVQRRDRAIGMSAGAPLLSVTRDAVRRSGAPTPSRARFEFSTDPSGVVVSVRVVDASPASPAWSDVAQSLAREARARSLAVPRGARGMRVTIEVASSIKTATGLDRGEASVAVASPVGTGVAKASRADQPLRFDLVLAPTQVDATMHFGIGDAVQDAAMPDRRVVVAQNVDETAL